jgi:hypothetical protein
MTKDNDYLKYLVKTLSKTNRKDYENYVINAIYQRVNNLKLIPVTQQYVRAKEKYYLIDLYFPQINLGIEINESYHYKQIKKDQIRLEKIYSSIDLKDFKLESIKIDTLENTEEEIKRIVKLIKKRIFKYKLEIETYEQKLKKIKTKKIIRSKDSFFFKKINDIAFIFGKNYKGMQRAYFQITEESDFIWCPTLSYEVNGKIFGNKKWNNLLSKDWNQIIETSKIKNNTVKFKNLKKEIMLNLNRIVFVKTKNNLGQVGYRFIGVFRLISDYNKRNKSVSFLRVGTIKKF